MAQNGVELDTIRPCREKIDKSENEESNNLTSRQKWIRTGCFFASYFAFVRNVIFFFF